MKVRIAAYFDPASGDIAIRPPQVDGTAMIISDPASLRVYSKPLLLLLAAYKLWSKKGDEPLAEEFRLTSSDAPGDVAARLCKLTRDSRRARHWSRPLLQAPAGPGRRGPAGRVGEHDTFEILPGDDGLRGRPAYLAPEGIEVWFENTRLDHEDDLRDLCRLTAVLCEPGGNDLLRYGGLRENLRYDARFGDRTYNPEVDATFRTADYQHFEATICFQRMSPVPMRKFYIGLIENGDGLRASIAEAPSGVIYREVYSVRREDREKLRKLREAVIRAEPEAREAELARLFQVRAEVDGVRVGLAGVEVKGNALYLRYELPAEAVLGLRRRFELSVAGFQPRSLHAFPIVISEPTRDTAMTFSYGDATVENVDFFVGAAVAPPREGDRATTEHSRDDQRFQFISPGAAFLKPGEGVVIYWTPPLRPEFIRLIDLERLNREHPRCLIAPPYATEENIFGERLYDSPKLFLTEEAAEQLRLVADELLEKHGLMLKVLDAYRPPHVQRRMAGSARGREFVRKGYLADPEVGSVHGRGCAVDLTLVDLKGVEVPMPTVYDDFSEAAHRATVLGLPDDDPGRTNFAILDECMTRLGFIGYEKEWWHYDLRGWRRYPVLDVDVYSRTCGPAAAAARPLDSPGAGQGSEIPPDGNAQGGADRIAEQPG